MMASILGGRVAVCNDSYDVANMENRLKSLSTLSLKCLSLAVIFQYVCSIVSIVCPIFQYYMKRLFPVRFAIAESLPAVSAIPAFYYFISIVFDFLVLRDRSLTEVRV